MHGKWSGARGDTRWMTYRELGKARGLCGARSGKQGAG